MIPTHNPIRGALLAAWLSWPEFLLWDYSSLRHRSSFYRGHQWLVLPRRHQWPLSECFFLFISDSRLSLFALRFTHCIIVCPSFHALHHDYAIIASSVNVTYGYSSTFPNLEAHPWSNRLCSRKDTETDKSPSSLSEVSIASFYLSPYIRSYPGKFQDPPRPN